MQVLEEYNGCVFAYGQTGTGKTYSMGTCNQPVQAGNNQSGIIPRAVNQIFDADPDLKVKVSLLSFNIRLISVSVCITLFQHRLASYY